MSLLLATQEGVYRVQDWDFDNVDRVLDSGVTLGVHTFKEYGSFAASKTGLYQSKDNGDTWGRLDVPQSEVYAVTVSSDDTRLYAGTHPAHIYVSTDEGNTWSELTGFQELPSRDLWHTPRHRGKSHVRSLSAPPEASGRVIAGVEVGGVHLSDDFGATWVERRDDLQGERHDDLQFDVHDVHVITSEEYVISCGGGLYRSRDSGKSWSRLDIGLKESYFQEAFVYQDTLYASAQMLPPTLPMGDRHSEANVKAALFESTDGGDTLEYKHYPGEPTEFIYAWTAADGCVLAGTTEGRVIVREEDEWDTLGFIPEWIRSMAPTEVNT